MKQEEHDYTVLMHLLPPLVNGMYRRADYDVSDKDWSKLEEFTCEHGENWFPLHDAEFPEDLIQYMAKCDVTGEIGWCVEIKMT